jgi:dipeptidyl aminopeptidase/acylaminoacyl peptidase
MKLRHTTNNAFSTGLFLAMFVLALPLITAAQGKIAFQSQRDGNNEIYVMNGDGSGQINLTNHPANDIDPSVSADGSKIVFASNRTGDDFEIYVMNADGTNVMPLTDNTDNDILPAISPDGGKIAFVSERDGNLEIYIMNADGSGETRLTNNSATDEFPSFNSDGSKIAFNSDRDGNNEIYVMNADGSNQMRLTFFATSTETGPSFSRDGSKIAFTSNRDGNNEIYVMNADGSNQARVTISSAFDASASFSPDGSKIAFQSSRDGNHEIYTVNIDGSNLTRLTFTDPFSDADPSWGGQATGGGGNAPPVLSNVAVSSPVNENSLAVLTGNISSPNAGDSFTLTVNWGDGSPAQTFNYAAGTTSFAESHTYADDNPTATASDNYNISLTLTTAGGSDTDSAVVTVNNVAPTLGSLALSPSTVTVGSPATLSGAISDVGTLDTHIISINWGDGSSNTTLNLAAGATNFSASHTYNAAGNFTITVTATDDDGGSDSGTISTSSNLPPAPNAPSNLRVVTVGLNQITIAWKDNSSNETGFVIEQCANKNCNNATQIGQVGANVTTFTHTGLLANTSYIYRVKAVGLGGSSAYSNTLTAKTLRR